MPGWNAQAPGAAVLHMTPPPRGALPALAACASLALACALAAFPSPMEAHADRPGNPCRLWVSGTLHYDVTDGAGNPRNNPGNTLYPGDAVRYAFNYGFSDGCASRSTSMSTSGAVRITGGTSGTAEALIAGTNDCHGGGGRGALGYGGEGGWARGNAKACGSITLAIRACEMHFHNGSVVCVRKAASDTLRPPTVAPVTETLFTEHVIEDPYGYMAANADHTNYPWDPIAIEHEADFDWKTEREGTITFEYDREFRPLAEEGGYECDAAGTGTLEVDGGDPFAAAGIGFLPYRLPCENGGGAYAYAATSVGDAGEHDIAYGVTVLNQGRVINTHTNVERQLVVRYDPVFEHYEYPVLGDGKKYAYDDRQGMVIRYGGSIGSGPGDSGALEPDRRARINAFYPETSLHSESLHPPLAVPRSLLEWDGIGHVDGTDQSRWESRGKHAMFTGDGYGILRLAQELSPIAMLQENVEKWYVNATTYNEIASDRWAGHESYRNWNYTYQYPHSPFAHWYNMSAHSWDGAVVPTQLTSAVYVLDVSNTAGNIPDFPPPGSNVVVMLDEYVYAKALHDTGDDHFATGVRDETHGMLNRASGAGEAAMWMNKTALEFPHGYVPEGGILNMTRYDAFDMDARYHAVMGAGAERLDRGFMFEFESAGYREMLTQESGAPLEAERMRGLHGEAGLVRVHAPEWMNTVRSATVDGAEVASQVECYPPCVLVARHGGELRLENVWGGSAVADLEPESGVSPEPFAERVDSSAELVWLVMAAGFVIFASYAALRKAFPLGGGEG